MSNIKVTDRRGGVFQVVIEFTYGECERLPFNILRRVNARIDPVPNGGITATADFNIRNPRESAAFLEMLDLFGEGGTFVHGGPADPVALACLTSPDAAAAPADDDDELEVEGKRGGVK